MNRKKWFSLLDQQQTYHHIYLDPESRPLTTFITLWGLYEWVRVPFGLSNALAEFQRYKGNCLTDVRDKFEFPYLDDVVEYSDDFDSHVYYLRKVFQILRENGIKVKAKKWKLFQTQINYLGRTTTSRGYWIDTSNMKEVTDLVINAPSNIGQLRRVLGLLGYCRCYVKGFSKIVEPLFDLLKKGNIKSSSKVLKASTSIHWRWKH